MSGNAMIQSDGERESFLGRKWSTHSSTDIDLFPDCVARYSAVPLVASDIFRVSRLGLASAQFWIDQVSVAKGRRKGREERRRDGVSFSPCTQRRTWDIEFRAKLKKTKSVRKVVSGTPCVQRRRATSPSRGSIGASVGRDARRLAASERECRTQAQTSGRSGTLPGSRSSNLAWVARICSALCSVSACSPRRTSLPFSLV